MLLFWRSGFALLVKEHVMFLCRRLLQLLYTTMNITNGYVAQKPQPNSDMAM